MVLRVDMDRSDDRDPLACMGRGLRGQPGRPQAGRHLNLLVDRPDGVGEIRGAESEAAPASAQRDCEAHVRALVQTTQTNAIALSDQRLCAKAMHAGLAGRRLVIA
jgi:hypothetical protein